MTDALFLVLALGLPFALAAPLYLLAWASLQREAARMPAYILRGYERAKAAKRHLTPPDSDT